MLSIIHDLPSNVVGVQATGVVSKADYENVVFPALADLYKRTGSVSLLLQIETDLHNYTTGAWIEDIKSGFRYLLKWRKVAIVSRNNNIKAFTDTFGILLPGQYKGFLMADLVEAKRWVSN
ncbi:MAG: STAS/SEC14 domain-containing protein [Bacteroidota bacterium]